MVRAAAKQGVEWHMWLYYFPFLTKKLVALYDDTADMVDKTAEWPNRAAYMLYQIFDALKGWIRLAQYLPPGAHHRTLAPDAPWQDNGNIPKSAAIVLGSCLQEVLLADNIGEHFKGYLANVAFGTPTDVGGSDDLKWLRAAAVKALAQGGPSDSGPEYRETANDYFGEMDYFKRQQLLDLQTALAPQRLSPD